MNNQAMGYTARQLAELGGENLPELYDTAKHLIYSSPATLAYNSPGAEGFGVKRAGLAIPGSVMLIVSPGCCGRNTSIVSAMEAYHDRFFYLTMNETDLITSRHLKKIPQAVEEIVRHLDKIGKKPSLVMICITCVDALLGTDMERVARKAEERVELPVRPCYMYALTREGSRPPMVHVRESLYSLLEPKKKRPTSVNLMGFFAPLTSDCEIFGLLRGIGVKKIRQISTCQDMDDFLDMAEANFNLVLFPEAREAAGDLAERLKIPYIELQRFYRVDRIEAQYHALGNVLGTDLEDEQAKEEAMAAIEKVEEEFPHLTFAIGEAMNGIPFELAASLLYYGFSVAEIYGNPSPAYDRYIKEIAEMSPETKIYSNMEPTMVYYDSGQAKVDITVGKDAAYYQPDAMHLLWNEDVQPYGYAGVKKFFTEVYEMAKKRAQKMRADKFVNGLAAGLKDDRKARRQAVIAQMMVEEEARQKQSGQTEKGEEE